MSPIAGQGYYTLFHPISDGSNRSENIRKLTRGAEKRETSGKHAPGKTICRESTCRVCGICSDLEREDPGEDPYNPMSRKSTVVRFGREPTDPVPKGTVPMIGTIQCIEGYVVQPNQRRPMVTSGAPAMAGGKRNSGSDTPTSPVLSSRCFISRA